MDFKDKKVKQKVRQMTAEGLASVQLYETACKFFDSDDYKEERNNDDYIQSIINARFSMAKIFNGLVPDDLPTRTEYLKKSLENYRFIKEFIKKKGAEKGSLNFAFGEQLKMADEMCEMLPVKIDKIRNGFLG